MPHLLPLATDHSYGTSLPYYELPFSVRQEFELTITHCSTTLPLSRSFGSIQTLSLFLSCLSLCLSTSYFRAYLPPLSSILRFSRGWSGTWSTVSCIGSPAHVNRGKSCRQLRRGSPDRPLDSQNPIPVESRMTDIPRNGNGG